MGWGPSSSLLPPHPHTLSLHPPAQAREVPLPDPSSDIDLVECFDSTLLVKQQGGPLLLHDLCAPADAPPAAPASVPHAAFPLPRATLFTPLNRRFVAFQGGGEEGGGRARGHAQLWDLPSGELAADVDQVGVCVWAGVGGGGGKQQPPVAPAGAAPACPPACKLPPLPPPPLHHAHTRTQMPWHGGQNTVYLVQRQDLLLAYQAPYIPFSLTVPRCGAATVPGEVRVHDVRAGRQVAAVSAEATAEAEGWWGEAHKSARRALEGVTSLVLDEAHDELLTGDQQGHVHLWSL